MDPPPPRPNAPAKTKDDEEEATPAAQMRVKSARQRRKVALKPGFSQLDWIRQVRVMAPRGFGRMRGITKEELRGHKERSSAWVAVRGVVYDATPYLEFHPGGVDMILKGAGKVRCFVLVLIEGVRYVGVSCFCMMFYC